VQWISKKNGNFSTQCRALRFTDGEIGSVGGWVNVFSPNDRAKNIKFGTQVASSTRMMHTLRFL